MALDPRLRNKSGQFSVKGTVTPHALRKAWSIVPRKPILFDAKLNLLQFDAVAGDFTADKIDDVNGVIRGVSVITSGLIARGHDLEVDGVTLDQIKLSADSKGQVPVKVNHKSGAEAICGYLCNFHQNEGKLKADWHLLQSHPLRPVILETARRMPRGVGLSASFVSPEKTERTKSGKNAARCEDLISVDYVTLPAANPDGMFEAKVDTPNSNNMTPEQIAAAIADAVKAAVAPLATQLGELKTAFEANAKKQTEEQPTDIPLEDALGMTEEELAAHGLTMADVQKAVEQAQAANDESAADEAAARAEAEAAAAGEGGEGGAAGKGAAVAAGAATAGAAPATSFKALVKQVHELSAKLAAAEGKKVIDAEAKLVADLEKDFEAVTARNVALEQALEAASKPASAGTDHGGVRFFSANAEEGSFENLVQLSIKSGKSPATAFQAVIRENPAAYEAHLVRRGLRAPVTL